MAANGIDPAAKSPTRIRRNWNRTSKGAIAETFEFVLPLALDAADRFMLTISSTGGLSGATSLAVKLATNSCLSTDANGLTVTVNSAGALTRTATGLQVAVDNSTIEIGSNALRLKSPLPLPPFTLSEAANGRMGTVTLVGGSATVSNTSVTANTRIFLSVVTPGGTAGFLDAGTRTVGTSFTITSSSVADTSTIAYLLIDPS